MLRKHDGLEEEAKKDDPEKAHKPLLLLNHIYNQESSDDYDDIHYYFDSDNEPYGVDLDDDDLNNSYY